MSHNVDTISVRADEKFDELKLSDFLKGKLEGSENPLHVRQFPGGKANLTYHLDYGSHEYVLRRPPLGPVAPTAHDMAREYSVLSVLHNIFPLAPKAYLFFDEESIVGAPFFIMNRHSGIVVRTNMPSEFADKPHAGRQMSIALADALAEFHKVDWKDKFSVLQKFKDERMQYFGKKILYEESPQSLSKEEYNLLHKLILTTIQHVVD